MIEAGSRAPDFDADSTAGRFRLSAAIESGPLVLFFYFKADTPG
jgi:peroxiredoxin